jgi:hypothetical protein
MQGHDWADSSAAVDWNELSGLYRIAPLGSPPAAELETIYGNCMFACFAYAGSELVAAGRALADGADCAGHKKIILYANPGREGFYAALSFPPMNTAMAIWRDPAAAIASGLGFTAACPAVLPQRPVPATHPGGARNLQRPVPE